MRANFFISHSPSLSISQFSIKYSVPLYIARLSFQSCMSCKVSRVPHFFSYLSHKSISLIFFHFYLDLSSPSMSVLHFPNDCPLSEQKAVKTNKKKNQNQQLWTTSYFQAPPFPSCRHAALTDRRWSPVSRGIQTQGGFALLWFSSFLNALLFHSEMKKDKSSFFIQQLYDQHCLTPNFYQILHQSFTSPVPPVTSCPLARLVLLTNLEIFDILATIKMFI